MTSFRFIGIIFCIMAVCMMSAIKVFLNYHPISEAEWFFNYIVFGCMSLCVLASGVFLIFHPIHYIEKDHGKKTFLIDPDNFLREMSDVVVSGNISQYELVNIAKASVKLSDRGIDPEKVLTLEFQRRFFEESK